MTFTGSRVDAHTVSTMAIVYTKTLGAIHAVVHGVAIAKTGGPIALSMARAIARAIKKTAVLPLPRVVANATSRRP